MKHIKEYTIELITDTGKQYFDGNSLVKENKMGDYYDKIVNKYITAKLEEDFPYFQIISEENRNEKLRSDYVWVVDPIDGTDNLIKGYDEFCISIGLLKDLIPVYGIVYAPVKKLLFHGETGKNSFLINHGVNKKISVSSGSELNECNVVISHKYKSDSRSKIIKNICSNVSYTGSASLRLCNIASGINDVNINLGHPLRIWDICASYAIVAGAGGIITDFNGRDFFKDKVSLNRIYGNFICTNKILHQPLLERINSVIL